MACMKFRGVNDKILHYGRRAAEHMLRPLQAFLSDHNRSLDRTRNAEQFLMQLGKTRGVKFTYTKDFPIALAGFTQSGVLCVRKCREADFEKCYSDNAVAKLLKSMCCTGAFMKSLNDDAHIAISTKMQKSAERCF